MQTVNFTADCQIQAAANGSPTVTILAYTGGIMPIAGFGQVVVDLDGMELASIPLLADHENRITSIAGSGTPEVRNGELHVAGRLAAGTSAADQILALHRSGVKLQASIGAEPTERKFIDAGKSVSANGKTFTAPAGGLTLVRRSTLREVSLVAMGADKNTTVAIAARLRKGNPMRSVPFNEFVSTMLPDTDLADMTDAQVAAVHANYHGRMEPNASDHAAVAPMLLASSDPVTIEERRLRQIEAACRGEWQEEADTVAELKASAIGGELSVDNLIQELRGVRQTLSRIPMARTISASRRDNGQVLTAALCLAGGIDKPEKHFPEPVLDHASRMTRDISVQQVIMQAAIANGYIARPAEGITQGNIRSVLEAAFAPSLRASGFSTVGLPNILGDVANKFLTDGWQETSGDEWKKISEVKPVKNFHQAKFYRMLDGAEYEQVGAGGEIKHGTLGESSMTVKADTYGKTFALTRQAIVNDDLGALTDVPRRLGRAAGMKFRRVYWAAFLAADSFFDAANGNVVTGAGTALEETGAALQSALTAFRSMRTSAADGRKLIGGSPAVLMVPPELEIVARRLLTSTGIVATGDTDTTMPSGNPFQGLAELVVVDWLSDSDLAGYDPAQWYLLRSPNIAPAMLVAFLNGQQSPTVEQTQADFNTLGIQFRGYHDFGVGRGEPLCGLQMAGTPAGE